jgi:DNA modification methylase
MKIDLRKGDCLDIMKDIPNDSVDLVVTDPPYKVTARGNSGNTGGMLKKKEVKSGKVFTHNMIEIDEWLPELYRVLKDKSTNVDECDPEILKMEGNDLVSKFLELVKQNNLPASFHKAIWATRTEIESIE